MTTQMFDVIIVGSGPAGLMAAITSARAGGSVAIFERLEKPALKLLATGGGRCNITNMAEVNRHMALLGRHGRFATDAYKILPPSKLRELLDGLGVRTIVEEDGKVYSEDMKAATIRDAMLKNAEQLGVKIFCGTAVTQITTHEKCVTGLIAGGIQYVVKKVVLAAGGCSTPKLGSDGSGFTLAQNLGHTIKEPTPALVSLITAETWVSHLAGVSLPDVELMVNVRRKKCRERGALLFTHKGLSGPAVLNLSGVIAELLRGQKPNTKDGIPLLINFTPSVSAEDWRAKIKLMRANSGGLSLGAILADICPKRVAAKLIELTGDNAEKTLTETSSKILTSLVNNVVSLPLHIPKTEGFDRSMVTRGGIKLKEIDPRTLMSRIVDGLFFVGEIVDLDAPTGGFNLQWAFASGFLVGAH